MPKGHKDDTIGYIFYRDLNLCFWWQRWTMIPTQRACENTTLTKENTKQETRTGPPNAILFQISLVSSSPPFRKLADGVAPPRRAPASRSTNTVAGSQNPRKPTLSGSRTTERTCFGPGGPNAKRWVPGDPIVTSAGRKRTYFVSHEAYETHTPYPKKQHCCGQR